MSAQNGHQGQPFFAKNRFGEIARRVLGEPNHQLSNKTELKYGTNGSLKVTIAGPAMGTWFSHEMGQGGGVLEFLELYAELKGKAAFDWLRDELGIVDNTNTNKSKPFGERIVATYDYQDEGGVLLFQVVRLADPKEFRQRRPDGKGDWIWKRKGIEPVLYHLPELDKAWRTKEPWRVYIVEGEKDVDRLRKDWGVLATTNPGGASKGNGGKWLPRWNSKFADAEVVIVPDNDEAGRDHARHIATSMLGHITSGIRWVKIVELSHLPEKGDMSDALDGGLSQGEFEDLVDSTEPLKWGDPRLGGGGGGSGKPPSGGSGGDDGNGSAPLFDKLLLSDIDMKPIEWLWQGRFARGKLSLIAGHPGLGKSTTALDITARISKGTRWPDGSQAPQGRVLIFSLEDDAADTIKPRLVAAGVDQEMVTIMRGVPAVSDDGMAFVRPFSIREDIARLSAEIEQTGNVVAIIIDPISAYLGNDGDGSMADSHSMADVRAILTPLGEMASRLNVAIIGITHLRKSPEGEAVLQVAGSLAFVAASRVCFFVMRDRDEPKRRLFLVAKNNLGDDTSGFAYSLKVHELETGPAVAVEWEPDIIQRTADEEIAERRASEKRQKDPNRNRLETDFVKVELETGPMAERILWERAKEAGFSKAKIVTVLNDIGAIRVLVERHPNVWGYQLP